MQCNPLFVDFAASREVFQMQKCNLDEACGSKPGPLLKFAYMVHDRGQGHRSALRGNFIDVSTLFSSDLYSVHDFQCYAEQRHVFPPGYTAEFCLNVTRKGYFIYNSFRRVAAEYSSRILIEKPGCEYTLTQELGGPGACTIIRFSDAVYHAVMEKYALSCPFFTDATAFSVMLASTAEADYLHHAILSALTDREFCKLEIDSMVMDLLEAAIGAMGNPPSGITLPTGSKQYHLYTIERAKEFVMQNFTRDISLEELAKYCYVSPFHFSRLFKQFCSYSPFQYLQHIRLKHAETMLRTTELPITDICYRSGFTRLDYFSTVFARKYKVSPTKYKLGIC